MIDLRSEKTIRQKRYSRWEAWLFYVSVGALACAPTQWTIIYHRLQIHPAEPLLIIAGILWLICWCNKRALSSLPPLVHWLFLAAVALGVFAGENHLQWTPVKEALKMGVYLVLAFTVFHASFTTRSRWRIAFTTVLITTSIAIAYAVVQRMHMYQDQSPQAQYYRMHAAQYSPMRSETRPTALWVCSSFIHFAPEKERYLPSRTAYCSFVALLLPFLMVLFVARWRAYAVSVCLALVLLLGIAISAMAGYVIPVMLVGAISTGLVLRRRRVVWVLVGILAYAGLVVALGHDQVREVFVQPYQLQIASSDSRDGLAHLKRFWGEQQVALNMLRHSPVLGAGAGEYQEKSARFWGFLGPISDQYPEVDGYNGYLITAASSGMFGLFSLVMLYIRYLQCAGKLCRSHQKDPWIAAAFGGVVILIGLTFVTMPFVRGTFLLVVSLFVFIDQQMKTDQSVCEIVQNVPVKLL